MTLAPDISNTVESAQKLQEEQDNLIPIRDLRQYNFDFDESAIVFTDSRAFQFVQSIDSIRLWIRKTLATERGVFAVYDNTYGLAIQYLIGSDISRSTFRRVLEFFVREALLQHPRITRIDNYTDQFERKRIFVEFDAIIDNEEVTPISFSVLGT